MTKDEILQLIKDTKELGLKSLEVDGVKIEFGDVEVVTKSENHDNIVTDEEPKAEDLVVPPSPYDQLTDEEILYWSSDYGQELELARKKEQEDNIKRASDDKE